ncbi:glycosyltransferase family 2 protein [Paenibacillus sp. Sa2BVA9]|uniref:Glycosyltransferase family 2 protein n=2 Tax=Paenibacillus gallinarum TaxID=2762232 RepID=A0ABR8SUJ2_9BACL|nr:glycosyltransferase family 2 protein [Paenibacillus gallinarum]
MLLSVKPSLPKESMSKTAISHFFYKMAGPNYFKLMSQSECLADKLFIELNKELEEHPCAEWLLWSNQGVHLSTTQEIKLCHILIHLPNKVQCVVYTVPGRSEYFFFRKSMFAPSSDLKLAPLPSAHWLAWELQQLCQARSTCKYLCSQNNTFTNMPLTPALKIDSSHGSILPVIQRTVPLSAQQHSVQNIGFRSSFPLVSILLSVHNMVSTIGWSIRSVLAQCYPHFELLIGDDGSTDQTAEKVSAMDHDHRIRIHRYATNRGKAFVLNDLLREATGTYVLELDADDWLPPGALHSLIILMEQNPCAALGTGTSLVWRKNRNGHISLRGQSSFEGTLETDTHAYPPVPRIYRTEHLRAVRGWTEYDGLYGRVFEDIEVCRKLLTKYEFAITEEIVYHRVVHTRSVSQQNLHQYQAWKQNRFLYEKGGEST